MDKCDICSCELEHIGDKQIGEVRYRILKCKKCNTQLVRRTD